MRVWLSKMLWRKSEGINFLAIAEPGGKSSFVSSRKEPGWAILRERISA